MTMNVSLEYQRKMITAPEAAALVKSGDWIFYGEFVLFPEACDEALAARAEELAGVDIRSVCYTRMPRVWRPTRSANTSS